MHLFKQKNMPKKQTGFVMIITLLALVIMLLASVALIRSSDANLLIAGNMAFKRDLINQAERMIPAIQTKFKTASVLGEVNRESNNAANNYSATILPANDSGIPDALIAIAPGNANNITDAALGITVSYVIDRMCLAIGPADTKKCTLAVSNSDGASCSGNNCQKTGGVLYPVYRITIRAIGPRNTETFMQTTYSD